jgi:hypothetical protein
MERVREKQLQSVANSSLCSTEGAFTPQIPSQYKQLLILRLIVRLQNKLKPISSVIHFYRKENTNGTETVKRETCVCPV